MDTLNGKMNDIACASVYQFVFCERIYIARCEKIRELALKRNDKDVSVAYFEVLP
jgi:hypothetical protein